MKKNDAARQRSVAEKWSSDDLRGIRNRIELTKIQSIGSLASVEEAVEILQFLQEIAPDFPLSQQRHFREAADELITLAIGHLERLRTGF